LQLTGRQSVSQSVGPSWPWAPPSLCLCVNCLSVLSPFIFHIKGFVEINLLIAHFHGYLWLIYCWKDCPEMTWHHLSQIFSNNK